VQKNCSKKIMAEKVQQKRCDRKITAEKVQQKNRGIKSGRKSAAEKSWQLRKSVTEKSRQQHGWGIFMRDMEHLV
jgi:hypothetical protein